MTLAIDIRARILDAAQEIVQIQGYGGFNYDQISDRFDIRIDSIESIFPRRAELGAALAARYRENFMACLDSARSTCAGSFELLQSYAGFFRRALVDEDRMCLCGLLGAEVGGLPGEVVEEVRSFFEANLAWLEGVLEEGRARNELCLEGTTETEAGLILATLEGAMLVARSTGRDDTFDESVATLLGRFRLRC